MNFMSVTAPKLSIKHTAATQTVAPATAAPPVDAFADLFAVQRLRGTWRILRRAIREVTARDVVDFVDWAISIDQSLAEISADVIDGKYTPQTPTRFEQPKSRGAYRVIASLNMRDALVYRHISDEALRRYLPRKVAGAFYSNKHSKTPVGKTFTFEGDSSHALFEVWLRYNEYRAKTLLNEPYKVLVVTDVTNYFESIQHDLLLEYLAPLGLPREATGLLGRLLEALKPATGHSPTPRVGLPVDEYDCSRELAHVFLFEHDRRVVDVVGEGNYVRWMDDQNIGARDMTEARKIVNNLTRSLYDQRLTLNSGKTKFLTPTDVVVHFQLDANERLNDIQDKTKTGVPTRASVRAAFEQAWKDLSTSDFASKGNWDKVLKRVYGLAVQVDSDVLEARAFEDLVDCPELAERIVTYFSRRNRGSLLLALFEKYIASGENLYEAIEFAFFQGFLDLQPTAALAGQLTALAEKFAKGELIGQTGKALGRASAVLFLYWAGCSGSQFARLFSRAEARGLPKEVARAWLSCGFALEVDGAIRAALMAHPAEDVGRLAYFLDDVLMGRVASLGEYRKLKKRWPLKSEYYDVRTWLQFEIASRAPTECQLGKRIKSDIAFFLKHASSRSEKRIVARVQRRFTVIAAASTRPGNRRRPAV